MSFKDTPTEKFFQFFHKKIRDEEITAVEMAKKFKKYEANPNVLLNGMKSGKNGVTIELILLAQEHFGLNPCSLFDKEQNVTIAEEDERPPLYNNDKMIEIISSQAATIASQATTIAKLTSSLANEGNRQASA